MHDQFFERIIYGNRIFYDMMNDAVLFNPYEDVSDHYSNERMKKVAPYTVDLEITRNCNLYCRNCFAECRPSIRRPEMSISTIENILKEREASKIRILITGGEPFLHTGIDRVLNLPGKFPRFKFALCTNGTHITPDYAGLLHCHDWLLIISLHGAARTHNEYTRSDAYDKVIRSMEVLLPGTKVKLYTMINEYTTKADIDHLFLIKSKYSISSIKFLTPRKFGRYKGKYSNDIVKYVESRMDKSSGIQFTSANREFVTVYNKVRKTM